MHSEGGEGYSVGRGAAFYSVGHRVPWFSWPGVRLGPLQREEAIKVWAPPCSPHSEGVGLLGFSRPERFCVNLFGLGRVG